MTERPLTILQINDLHGYLEPHPDTVHGTFVAPGSPGERGRRCCR